MRLLVLFALLASYGCPALRPSRRVDQDMLDVARVGLAQVQTAPDSILVAGPNLQPGARQSLERLRKVITPADVPESADYTLPPGHVIVEQLEVTGNRAVFAALVGPVPRSKPGEILLACGTRYSISMKKETNGTWVIDSVSVAVC